MSNHPAPTTLTKQQAYDRLENLITKAQPKIAKRLPVMLTPERMITDVLTTLQRSPKLLFCDPVSILGTVVQAAEIGLRLNGFLGEAYMVPFWNSQRERFEAQLQVGYRGMITLARRSGEVTKIEPRLVFEFDHYFDIKFGTDPVIEHEPAVDHPDYMRRDETGDLIGLKGAYAVCTYKDGKDFEYCNIIRLAELRNRSKARDAQGGEVGPWTTDPGEMYRKVPIRQLAKRLPLTSDDGRFQKAAMLDEYGDAGVRQGNDALLLGGEFADDLASITQNQVQDLAAKHAVARPQVQPPAHNARRAYQPRNRRQQAAA